MSAAEKARPKKRGRKSRRPTLASGPSKPRQRPTLPQGCPCSTIGPEELNFRVRDGNGCDLFGIAARKNLTKCEARRHSGECDRSTSVLGDNHKHCLDECAIADVLTFSRCDSNCCQLASREK